MSKIKKIYIYVFYYRHMKTTLSRNYAKEHIEIMNELERHLSEGKAGCIMVNSFAKNIGKDVRTVRAHLEIASVHKKGTFVDKKFNIFCTKDGIKKIYQDIEGGE